MSKTEVKMIKVIAVKYIHICSVKIKVGTTIKV